MIVISLVIARVIAESGAPMPALTDDSVLMIKRTNVVVGDGCNGGDAGVGDAGVDAPDDGPMLDAGTDGGTNDAPGDAGVADAGCTTIPGDAITLVVQPRFMTAPQGLKFALLFVTPARPIVETKSSYLFEELERVTQPKVEVQTTYVEDPRLGTRCRTGSEERGAGCGGGWPSYEEPTSWDPPTFGDGGLGDGGLVVETIGPYEVLRAEPADVNELATWLTGLNYRYDQADLDAVAPYIALDYTVVAVRVAVGQPTTTTFTPIALTWAGSELRLPSGFGTAPFNVAMTVYVAADGRYDLAGAYVPFANRTGYAEPSFLTKNQIVIDSGASPTEDPIATRVHGDPSAREVDVQEEIIRKPVSGYCNDDDVGCCGNCSTGRHRVRPDMIVVVVACGFVVLRKRRRREQPLRAPRAPHIDGPFADGDPDQPRPRR